MDYLDPNKLEDTAASSLRKNLGQQAELEGRLVELKQQLERLPENAASGEQRQSHDRSPADGLHGLISEAGTARRSRPGRDRNRK